jgi:hypothetical protein
MKTKIIVTVLAAAVGITGTSWSSVAPTASSSSEVPATASQAPQDATILVGLKRGGNNKKRLNPTGDIKMRPGAKAPPTSKVGRAWDKTKKALGVSRKPGAGRKGALGRGMDKLKEKGRSLKGKLSGPKKNHAVNF